MLLPFMVHQFFSSLESLFYLSAYSFLNNCSICSANSFLSNCSIWGANSFFEQLFDLGCPVLNKLTLYLSV